MRHERYGYNVYLEIFMKSGYTVSIFVEQAFLTFKLKKSYSALCTLKRKEDSSGVEALR
jgi:hypothetical protein